MTTVPAAAITSASGVFSCSALEGRWRCGRRQVGQPLRRSPPRRLPWPSPAVMQTRSRLTATSACGSSTAVTAVANLDPVDNAKAAVLIYGDGWSPVGSHPARQAATCTTHSPHRTRPRHCHPNTRYSLRHWSSILKEWYQPIMSKQPQQPAVTGTGPTRGHTCASPRYCVSASPRETWHPARQRPRSPAHAQITAWPARPQLTPCMSFRMPGSYTGSPDSATTSATTDLPIWHARRMFYRTCSRVRSRSAWLRRRR